MNFCHVDCPSLAWAVLGLGQGVVIFWFGFWFSRAHSSLSPRRFLSHHVICVSIWMAGEGKAAGKPALVSGRGGRAPVLR